MKRLAIVWLALGLAVVPILDAANKEDVLLLDLRQAVTIAARQQVRVLVARERVQQALSQLSEARSFLLPQVSAAAGETRQTRNLEAQGITIPGRDPLVGPFNSFDARLKLTQTIFDAAAFERLRSAQTGRSLSLAQERKASQDAMALAATLYLRAKRAAETLDLAQVILDRDKKRWTLARTNLRIGTGADWAVTQAQADLAESRHHRELAASEARERFLDLVAALGLPGDQPLRFAESETVEFPLPKDGEIEPALERHPDVQVARRSFELSQSERSASSAQHWPKASVSGDYGKSGKSFSDSENTYTMGGQLSLPLFEGGRTQARVRGSASQVREQEAVLDDTLRQQRARIWNARDSARSAWDGVRAQKEDWDAASQQWTLMERRRKLGTASRQDVIEATAALAAAKDRYEDLLSLYHMALVSLAHDLGRMEELASPARIQEKTP